MPFCHLDSSNLDLHYTLHGVGPNKVLFVMGLITDGGAWALQTDYFALHHPEYQCVTYDHRGIGKSSLGNTWRHTTSLMANDAIGLVNHLGWERFHVVGVSMGGMISIELACTYPQRILSLSLIATHAGGFPYATVPQIRGTIQLFRSIMAPTEQLRVERAMSLLYGKKTLLDESKRTMLTEHHIKRLRNREKPQIAGIIAQFLAIPSHYVSYSRLLRIRYCPFPTLVLVGTEDALVRTENSRIIARTICATKYVVVDGAGHAPLAEDAEIVNQELLENFKRGDELKNLNTADQAKYHQHLKALDLCCSHRASCFLHIAANTIKGFATGAIVGTFCRFLLNNDYLYNDRTTWSPMWRLALIVAVARCGYTSFTCLRRSIIAYLAFKKLAKTHSHSSVRDNVLEEREHISSEHYWFPISPIFYLLAASWMALKYRNQIVA